MAAGGSKEGLFALWWKIRVQNEYSPELAEANTILCLEIFTSGEPR
jgi:hypothetical protein